MKKIQIIMAAAALGLMTGACSSDKEVAEPALKPEVMHILTQLDAPTRAGLTADGIRNFVLKIENPSNPEYTYNVHMIRSAQGEWKAYDQSVRMGAETPEKEVKLYWQNARTPVNVTAVDGYMPSALKEAGTKTTIRSYQTLKSNLEDSDLVVARAEGVMEGSADGMRRGNDLVVKFAHRLAFLKIEVELNTELSQNTPDIGTISPIAAVDVEGYCQYNYSAKTDLISKMSNFNTISLFKGNYRGGSQTQTAMQTFEAVVLPYNYGARQFNVYLTIFDKDYMWTCPSEVNLEAGKINLIKLRYGKEGVEGVSFSASEWVDGGTGDIQIK